MCIRVSFSTRVFLTYFLLYIDLPVIDGLFEKRRIMETKIIELKLGREDKMAKELEDARVQNMEDYNKLKMNLEHNIQLLEQQLEEVQFFCFVSTALRLFSPFTFLPVLLSLSIFQMRATYQLNAEKLEYNFRVLKERDTENRDTIANQKAKLKRSKEALMKVKERYQSQDEKFQQENDELKDDFMRITEQFKDLQRKFRHFESIDRKKYEEVWGMNEQRVMDVGHKVCPNPQSCVYLASLLSLRHNCLVTYST